MFRPMKAPNEEIKLEDLKYPLIASYKLDGIRCVFREGKMLSCSLTPFANNQLCKRFQVLTDYSNKTGRLLDGELLSKSLTFNELSGLIRALDRPIPNDLFFYMFDAVENDQFNEPFTDRIKTVEVHAPKFPGLIKPVQQRIVTNIEETKNFYQDALAWGCDGLILRSFNGKYKTGRGTLKEGLIFKHKPYRTFEAQIIDVVQATTVDPMAEKTVDRLGYSETSKKKGDRIPIESACDFVVLHEGQLSLKVVIAMTDVEKAEVWKNRQSYIDRWIEYKGMLVGSKDLPRHPVYLRFRDDKNV